MQTPSNIKPGQTSSRCPQIPVSSFAWSWLSWRFSSLSIRLLHVMMMWVRLPIIYFYFGVMGFFLNSKLFLYLKQINFTIFQVFKSIFSSYLTIYIYQLYYFLFSAREYLFKLVFNTREEIFIYHITRKNLCRSNSNPRIISWFHLILKSERVWMRCSTVQRLMLCYLCPS